MASEINGQENIGSSTFNLKGMSEFDMASKSDLDFFAEKERMAKEEKEAFRNGGWLTLLNKCNPNITYKSRGEFQRACPSSHLYSVKTLDEIAKIVCETHDEKKARFVLPVDEKGAPSKDLLFAREGRPERVNIFSHTEVAHGKPVACAGTVTFNKEGLVDGIDNKSSYWADFSALAMVLNVLKNAGKLAPMVQIDMFENGGHYKDTVRIRLAQLDSLNVPPARQAITSSWEDGDSLVPNLTKASLFDGGDTSSFFSRAHNHSPELGMHVVPAAPSKASSSRRRTPGTHVPAAPSKPRGRRDPAEDPMDIFGASSTGSTSGMFQ